MDSMWLAAGSALWLGILTSISPCPLSTNIAAVSYVGRRVGNGRAVLFSGVLYTGGRSLVYLVLGAASVWVPCAIYLAAVDQRYWAAAILARISRASTSGIGPSASNRSCSASASRTVGESPSLDSSPPQPTSKRPPSAATRAPVTAAV